MSKKVLKTLVVLVLVLGSAVLCRAQTKSLTILHTNDTHSTLLPFGHPSMPGPNGPPGEYGGIARMAALIKEIRLSEPNVLVLNAGDVFTGSFEFNKYLGYAELKIMEGLYDAMALGNHEFDLGMNVLAGVVSGALAGGEPVGLPLLCANINFAGHPLSSMIRPSIIKEIDGLKIGIFGLIEENPVDFGAEVIGRFSGAVFGVAQAQAADLKAAGCDIVICLSHLGTRSDEAGLTEVPGLDIVVGGHSHDLFDSAVMLGGKIIVQAGDHGRYLGELEVDYEAGQGVTLRGWKAWPIDSRVKADPAVQARVNELRDGVVADPRFGPVYSQFVGLAVEDIAHDWPSTGPNRDTPLGNLVADAMKKAVAGAGFPVDCVLDAHGYTEFGIPAGRVVGNDVMRAVPYGYDPASGLGFKLVVAPLPGALLLGGLEYSTSMVEYTSSLCLQVSGLTFAYDSSKPPASQLGQISRLDPMSVKVGEEFVALNPGKYYCVVMTDQVFAFLNSLVGGQLVKLDTGILEYNAVRDYMQSLHSVSYASEGRVRDTKPAAAVK
ncbi:MAG: 5'-nucleotidase protein [Candidatus Aminicenantes bacterium]|nr:5'-nucleotidase protein [Candidatus Aminicenantes bacterium]